MSDIELDVYPEAKPAEEQWRSAGTTLLIGDFPIGTMCDVKGTLVDDDVARAKLAAAAPEMLRVLLQVEWEGGDCAGTSVCPACAADKYPENRRRHDACPLDAALTAAGFPDQASREAARERVK